MSEAGPSRAVARRSRMILAALWWMTGGVAAAAESQPKPTPEAEPAAEEPVGSLEDEFALLEDEAVVELPARHRQAIGMSPSTVTVITRDDIEASGASTIPDLLRLVPGMEVVVVTPFFTSVEAGLNWNYENNVYLVLVDGREANSELLGQPPWQAQPISLDDIERIEILRGPGSALYGANAFAGVISITTRALPESGSAFVGLAAGEVGTLRASARAGTRIGRWRMSLNAGVEQAGAYYDPGRLAMEVWKLRGVAELRLGEASRLLLDAGLSSSEGTAATGVGPLQGRYGLRMVRLAFDSPDLRAQLYWTQAPLDVLLDTALIYRGVPLAEVVPAEADTHTLDGQLQWTLPQIYEPLLLMVGAAGRVTNLASEQLLDAATYTDLDSPRYRQPGIDHWEVRAGAFAHAEWTPTDWLAVTGGLRFDYNTVTGHFISPRLAAVFRPAAGQHLRLGVARAFRKPSLMETHVHPMVEVPAGSPVGRQEFEDFMTRVIGNTALDDEELISCELGYLGRFFDGRLRLSLNLYFSRLNNQIDIYPDFHEGSLPGLPDLSESSFQYLNAEPALDIFGGELAVRYRPLPGVVLLAAWSHKQVYYHSTGSFGDTTPKNLITLGGRFRTDGGLVGSLYAFARSEFWDRSAENPQGALAGFSDQHQPDQLLLLGRLGYRRTIAGALEVEAGLKLFLPISPFQAPYFRTHECGGGLTADGRPYGGYELQRIVSLYLQGAY